MYFYLSTSISSFLNFISCVCDISFLYAGTSNSLNRFCFFSFFNVLIFVHTWLVYGHFWQISFSKPTSSNKKNHLVTKKNITALASRRDCEDSYSLKTFLKTGLRFDSSLCVIRIRISKDYVNICEDLWVLWKLLESFEKLKKDLELRIQFKLNLLKVRIHDNSTFYESLIITLQPNQKLIWKWLADNSFK